jgi:hypothetical protein
MYLTFLQRSIHSALDRDLDRRHRPPESPRPCILLSDLSGLDQSIETSLEDTPPEGTMGKPPKYGLTRVSSQASRAGTDSPQYTHKGNSRMGHSRRFVHLPNWEIHADS